MAQYKRNEEVEIIRENCLLVCNTLAHVGGLIKPGISGMELDKAAETFIRDHGAKPGFKGYRGFPASLCISINECVVHGIPSEEEIRDGDIVSIDCGTYMNGYYGDAAYTFAVGEQEEEALDLMSVTNESLYLGIEQAVVGNRLGDIGFAVQNHVEKTHRFSVVRALVGHGIGEELHEPPEVPNFGKRGRGPILKDGLVIAIEPMVNMGVRSVVQSRDGWTIRTKDRKPSAHYEHTVVVRNERADILSDHTVIEEAVKNNPDLQEISLKNAIFALRNFQHG